MQMQNQQQAGVLAGATLTLVFLFQRKVAAFKNEVVAAVKDGLAIACANTKNTLFHKLVAQILCNNSVASVERTPSTAEDESQVRADIGDSQAQLEVLFVGIFTQLQGHGFAGCQLGLEHKKNTLTPDAQSNDVRFQRNPDLTASRGSFRLYLSVCGLYRLPIATATIAAKQVDAGDSAVENVPKSCSVGLQLY